MASHDASRPTRVGPRNPVVRGLLVTSIVIIAVGWAIRTLAEAGGLLSQVLIPVALAVLVTALLMPFQVLLNHRAGLPRSLSAGLTLLGAIAGVVGLLWVSGAQLASGVDDIVSVVREQLEDARRWLLEAFPQATEQIDEVVTQFQGWIEANQTSLAQGALGAGVGAAGFFVSLILMLVATFFFLAQGDRLWATLLKVLPDDMRRNFFEASRRGWVTLGTYCRTSTRTYDRATPWIVAW